MGMESILVPVVLGEKNIWLVIHALQLARRLGGSVTVLEIDVSEDNDRPGVQARPEHRDSMRTYWAKQAELKEVNYEHVQVKGGFCDEIRRLCQQNSFSTLVLEMSVSGKNTTPAAMLKMVSNLQAERICKVELLGKK